jgi:hypothetical protein
VLCVVVGPVGRAYQRPDCRPHRRTYHHAICASNTPPEPSAHVSSDPKSLHETHGLAHASPDAKALDAPDAGSNGPPFTRSLTDADRDAIEGPEYLPVHAADSGEILYTPVSRGLSCALWTGGTARVE